MSPFLEIHAAFWDFDLFKKKIILAKNLYWPNQKKSSKMIKMT